MTSSPYSDLLASCVTILDQQARILCDARARLIYEPDLAEPGDQHPGQRYGRAKRALVAHILGQHGDEFLAAHAPRSEARIA